jgi:hypothetical protein
MIKKKEEKKTLKVTPMMTKTARQTIFLSKPKVRRRQRSWIRSLLGKESRLWRREWQQRYCQFRRWQCLGHQQLQQVVVNQRVEDDCPLVLLSDNDQAEKKVFAKKQR